MKKILSIISLIIYVLTSNAQVTKGLIAHWPLDGNANEIGSDKLNGTITGSVVEAPDNWGNPCGAMRFSNGGYIVVPDNKAFNKITKTISICAWAKLDSLSDNWWISILNKGEENESSNSPHFRFQFTKLTLALTNRVPIYDIEYDKGNWHHWAITFDGANLTAYMDAMNIGSFDYPESLNSNTYPIEIGRDITGNTENFNGCLDEITIYNRSLSLSEIRSIYISKPNVNCGGQQCPLPDMLDGIKIEWAQHPVVVKSKMLRLFVESTTESAHRQIGINFNGTGWRNAYLPQNRTCIFDVQIQSTCNYLVFKSLKELAVFKADIDGVSFVPSYQETDVNRYVGIEIIYEP